jgi:uncharacterized membrane protein YagU involved in acid resistance
MSVAMVLMHRRLPRQERYSLPPREITTKAIAEATPPSAVDPATRSSLTWLAHFGYGGVAGAFYAAAARQLPGNAPTKGSIFGLTVWIVSYLGLLPGLKILKPATDHPMNRNLLMIGAHLVWGIFLAAIYEVLSDDLGRTDPAFHASTRPHADT